MDSFISYDRENGYNLAPTAGSMLGFKHSDKTKNKISKVQIGKKLSEQTKKKISESNKGEKSYWYGKKFTNQHIQKVIQKRKENGTLKHTKEAKEKISNALRKRVRKKESYEKVSEKLSVPVCQYDKYGNFLNEWVSITEASKSLGIHRGNISLVLKGKRKSSGGFIWKYKSEVEVENDNQSYPKTS
jgi:group I intron endonuclease